jgi:hypothetical protein
MRKLMLSCALALCALAGGDVSGTWQFDVQTDQGSGSPTFVLQQQAGKLTGTYSGLLGKADVQGTVKGDEIVIEFETDAAGEKMTVRYAGKLEEGDTRVKGRVTLGDFSGTFTGTKGKGRP